MKIKKYNFKEAGEQLEIFEPVSLIGQENFSIKERVRISEFTLIAGGQGTYIGNFIHIANHVSIVGGGVCVIEDFVGICAGARIITGTDDVSGQGIPSPMVSNEYRSYYRSFVVLKKHSFIGTNVIIHPGVTIGEGVVVASGSVVTKNLDDWGVYKGVPATRVKDREKNIILNMENEIYNKYKVIPSDFSNVLKTHGY